MTDPPWLVERLVLVSVDGQPLPQVVQESPGSRLIVIGDTLMLRADGTGVRASAFDFYFLTPNGDGTTTISAPQRHYGRSTFTWSMAGDRFTAALECPPNADCFAPPHLGGTFHDGVLTLDLSIGSRTPLRYLAR